MTLEGSIGSSSFNNIYDAHDEPQQSKQEQEHGNCTTSLAYATSTSATSTTTDEWVGLDLEHSNASKPKSGVLHAQPSSLSQCHVAFGGGDEFSVVLLKDFLGFKLGNSVGKAAPIDLRRVNRPGVNMRILFNAVSFASSDLGWSDPSSYLVSGDAGGTLNDNAHVCLRAGPPIAITTSKLIHTA